MTQTGSSDEGCGRRPDVSVIVPTRNRAALLERLLQQIFRFDQGLQYEVIVVDEGSTDRTSALLEELGRSRQLTVIRHSVPVGLSEARNVGIRASSGRYVAWIDDDDLTSTDRLRRQFDSLESSGLRWSCAGRVDIDDDLRIIGHVPCPPTSDFLRRILAFNILPTAGDGLLVDRDLLDEIGEFDRNLDSAEDWDLCIRLASRAEPHMLDEPLVAYRTGVASMSTNTRRMEAAIRVVLQKNRSLREIHRVEPDWAAIHRSLLAADLLNSRRDATRRAAKLFWVAPTLTNALRCAAALLTPGRLARHSATRRISKVPEGWRRTARMWLDQIPLQSP